jgi:pilus assembly protein CpaB
MASVTARAGMRSRGSLWITIAAIALGLLTAVLILNYLRTQDSERRALSDASVAVVVASREIRLGTNITSSMLELKHVTPDVAVTNAYPEPAQVIGLRARSTIAEGSQVVPSMVVQSGTGDALSFVVPPGKRAVAITGSDVVGGGGHIRPGDFVDVLVAVDTWKLDSSAPSTNGAEKPKAVVTMLQNVEVLAVSDAAQKVADSGPDSKSKKDSDIKSLDKADNKSVTLSVEPAQAELLFLAETEGKVRLALRPFGEREEQVVPPATLAPAGAKPATR